MTQSKNTISTRLFTLILLLLSSIVSAQTELGKIEIEYNETLPKEKGNIMAVAGIKNDSIYVLSRTKKEFFFQTFDAETKKISASKPFEIEEDFEIRDYIILSDKLFLMLSLYDSDSNVYRFIAKEVRNNQIIKSTELLTINAERYSRKGEFLFKISNDNSKYLITHVNKNYRNSNVDYTMNLIDGNLNTLFSDKETISSENKKVWSFKFSDTNFNDNGDIVFSLVESYRNKNEKNKYNYVTIFSYKSEKNYEKQLINIELKDKYIADCNVVPTKGSKLHLTGFYSNLRKSGRAFWHYKGIYDIVIDFSNGEVLNVNFNPFPNFIYDLFINKFAKEGKGLNYEVFKNVAFIERDGGGIIVLTEYDWKSGADTFGIWPLAWTSYYFDSRHVIITALDSAGNLDWSNFIPKDQSMSIDIFGIQLIPSPNYTRPSSITFPLAEMGSGEEYLSVFPIYQNGIFTVLFNDDIRNDGTTPSDELWTAGNLKKMKTVAYTFDDNTGTKIRIEPKQFEKGQIILKPLIDYRFSDDEYLIFGGNKEENAIGVLKVKK